MRKSTLLALSLPLLASFLLYSYPALADLRSIKLPPGFRISVFAQNVPGARSLSLGPKGIVFVGSRQGEVYALEDKDGDFRAEKVYTVARNLNFPNGVAYYKKHLYIAEIDKILRIKNISQHLRTSTTTPEVIYENLPKKSHHGWKFIAFGPDGKLYIPVGAPCNICDDKTGPFAKILRLNIAAKEIKKEKLEVVAHGVRNTVGFDWHPETKKLWFTDNGRDLLGDDQPPDELNRVSKSGNHFGYPFCHGGDILEPTVLARNRLCSEFVAPVRKLGAHVAALGMRFYRGKQFPKKYHNQIFIAEHGSWNRSSKSGYRITLVTMKNNGAKPTYTSFATGWLQGEKVSGRPVDVLNMPDGSLLVSDDLSGQVYRISYKK